MLPKALKSCPKSNKLPNLVTLFAWHIIHLKADAAKWDRSQRRRTCNDQHVLKSSKQKAKTIPHKTNEIRDESCFPFVTNFSKYLLLFCIHSHQSRLQKVHFVDWITASLNNLWGSLGVILCSARSYKEI